MPRITISINASGEPNDQDLLTLDLPPGLTIADLKGMIEAETKFPANIQTLFFNGQALRSDTQTLEQADIKDGEMLAVMVRRPDTTGNGRFGGGSARGTYNGGAGQARRPVAPPEADTPARIEQLRQDILANPPQLAGLIEQSPQLAEAVHDSNRFLQVWMRMLEERNRLQREREEEMKMLNEDPFNVDAQKKIAEMIRREKIEANLQYAIENNPEVFGRVSMLYVDVVVNNVPIKAFVDSGAQTTIMSPSCAESCGLSYLIDERFGGIARGVGTARILGRVHQAKIQIGDAELDCAFTVMEGKDVDLLFGLDMLRRHQACIDLLKGELRFPHTSVKFLPESEIPKKFEETMMDEPTVPAPNGMEVGANTGSVRPAGSSAAAANHLHGGRYASSSTNAAGKQAESQSSLSEATGLSTADNSASSSGAPASRPQAPTPASATKWPEASIQQLIGLGFDRQRAIAALDATDGNLDYAASMLFQ
ncbi:uncharacterized protein PV09_03035 [Verruconis gallopava]|uniref:DNA damage-inducible protein 1 n=1 Tax=Verruconis gallopava TaxID=253628 RepID=A0A0D2B3I0_9PEZI|nr:uncharacterized protein PV09_03035 [Verruconis gallopava]KIW05829.1 hypothetical protein PV09_03035 [Verruconis gallopava]